MDLSEFIQPGMRYEENFLVEGEHTAIHLGSGSLRVLATPWMIAYMERVSHRLLAQHLPEGFSSVGAQVNVHHLAPTPVGDQVHVRSEVLEVNGRRVTFAVHAWDQVEKVGEGQHLRVVIEVNHFLQRAMAKKQSGN